MSAMTSASSQPGASRNERSVPSKSIVEVRGGERAGREAGQEGPDAGRRGQPDAREDVEEGVHGPLRSAAASAPAGEPCQMSLPPKRSRPAARDLERYAGLFAQRTNVMTSSAMRDLMAITERPEVISLAGGLPDTSTFPPESYASIMQRVAAEATARALQYGPTEGHGRRQGVHRARSWPRRARRSTPTTCSSPPAASRSSTWSARRSSTRATSSSPRRRRIPARCRSFRAYEADVVQIEMDADGHAHRRARGDARPPGARGAHARSSSTRCPTFQNPAGVTMSLAAGAGAWSQIAAERELLVLEDNPYGLLRYEGEPLPTLRSLDGGEFVIYLGTFSKILSAGLRLGWTVAPAPGAGEDEPRQAGRRPLLVVDDAVLRRRVLRASALARLPRLAARRSTAVGAT